MSAQWVQDELGIPFHCPVTGCITCFAILLFVRLFAEPVPLGPAQHVPKQLRLVPCKTCLC